MKIFVFLALIILSTGCDVFKLKITHSGLSHQVGGTGVPVLEFTGSDLNLKFQDTISIAPVVFDDLGMGLSDCSINPALPTGLELILQLVKSQELLRS